MLICHCQHAHPIHTWTSEILLNNFEEFAKEFILLFNVKKAIYVGRGIREPVHVLLHERYHHGTLEETSWLLVINL